MTGTGELRRGGRRGEAGRDPGPGTLPRARAAESRCRRSLIGAAAPIPDTLAEAGLSSPGPSGPRSRSPGPSLRPGPPPRGSRGSAPRGPSCPRSPSPGMLGPPLPAAVRGAEARGQSGPEGPAAAARSAPGAGTPRAAPGGQSGGLCVSGEGSGRVSLRGLQCHRHSGGCESNAGRYRLQPGNQPVRPAVVRDGEKNLFTQVATDFSCLLFVVPRPAGASHSRMTHSFAPLFRRGGWDAVACSMLHGSDGTGEW